MSGGLLDDDFAANTGKALAGLRGNSGAGRAFNNAEKDDLDFELEDLSTNKALPK